MVAIHRHEETTAQSPPYPAEIHEEEVTKPAYKNQHLEIWKINDRAKEIRSHYYLHEKWCYGRQVALLPFRFGKNRRVEYLLRKEIVPAWRTDVTCMTAISGEIYQAFTDFKAILKQLDEKTGFDLTPASRRLKYLGACHGSKRIDTVYDLYAVNVHGLTQEPPEGDGTAMDDLSTCHWVVDSTIGMAVDPLVYILHYRTARYIRRLARPRAQGNPSRILAGIHAR